MISYFDGLFGVVVGKLAFYARGRRVDSHTVQIVRINCRRGAMRALVNKQLSLCGSDDDCHFTAVQMKSVI
jgi:hypothetical protein